MFTYLNFDPEAPNYQPEKEKRWIPLRTRYDKTFQYQKGSFDKNYMT